MVSQGRLGLEKFVSLTATEAARIYGLYPRKGEIVIGADADMLEAMGPTPKISTFAWASVPDW